MVDGRRYGKIEIKSIDHWFPSKPLRVQKRHQPFGSLRNLLYAKHSPCFVQSLEVAQLFDVHMIEPSER